MTQGNFCVQVGNKRSPLHVVGVNMFGGVPLNYLIVDVRASDATCSKVPEYRSAAEVTDYLRSGNIIDNLKLTVTGALRVTDCQLSALPVYGADNIVVKNAGVSILAEKYWHDRSGVMFSGYTIFSTHAKWYGMLDVQVGYLKELYLEHLRLPLLNSRGSVVNNNLHVIPLSGSFKKVYVRPLD